MGEQVFGTPLSLGVLTFAFGCVVAALYLLGVESQPADKVTAGAGIMFKWVGIVLLPIGVPVIIFSNGAGPLTAWVAVIWGLFGIVWLGFSDCISKGADFRPLSYFTGFVGVMCWMVVWMSAQIASRDFVIGFTLAALTCWSAMGAMRFKPKWMKVSGILFLLTGLWFTYVGFSVPLGNLWPLPPA